MNENICISKNYFFTLFLLFISFTTYYVYTLNNINKVNYYKEQTENKNDILSQLPLRQLLENRDRSVLYDPLIAPERRIDVDSYPIKLHHHCFNYVYSIILLI